MGIRWERSMKNPFIKDKNSCGDTSLVDSRENGHRGEHTNERSRIRPDREGEPTYSVV